MSRRLLILLAVLALAVGVLTPVAAGAAGDSVDLAGSATTVEKSEYGSYIVVMTADPLLADFDQDELDSKAANTQAKGLAKGHDKALKDAGVDADAKVNEYVNAVNGFSAFLSYEEALALAADKNVAMVMADEMYQATTDNSPTFLGIDSEIGPWANDYDGEGVVIGVIDTGIWPEHPSFEDDGTFPTPPIALDESARSACDFGNTDHNSLDAPFECNNKLIGARQMLDTYRHWIDTKTFEYDSARDENGHGTHTASTAGGNAGVEASIFGIPRGTVSGIAPRAHIVAYKGLGFLGGFGSDLAAAIDQAVADGVDVINYSIGGGSSLTGADDIAFLFAASAGVFVATSAGNSGPGAETVGSPGNGPWITTVGASTQDRTFQGSAILGDGEEYFGASITDGTTELPLIDAADAGGELCYPGELDAGVVAGKIVLCKRGEIARVAKSQAVFIAGGAGMILYNASDAQSQVTDNHFVPSVHINNTDGMMVKDYITAKDPAAKAMISGGVFTEIDGNSMASFSSRGANDPARDLIKPDVTAPGVNILAGNTPTPEPGNVAGELFQSISGTSMSSPHVAGVFALIKQAHPDWSAAMAKSALMTSARQDIVKEDGTTPADPFDMGAGHIDPGSTEKSSPFDPGIVYDAGLYEYAAFTCGADLGIFTAGSCVFLESIGIPTDASDFNVASIGVADLAGTQTITRTVTNVSRSALIMEPTVVVPAGYDITVSPSRLVVPKGRTASYTVTIANVNAPIGEWRFGSLTWSSADKPKAAIKADYSVQSPIAVRGALFAAAPEVVGSGESGSLSFDVGFGYTGEYTAAPHGLATNLPATGAIGQDPDQTYPSSDDAPGPNGGVDEIKFTVTDSAFVRWELVIPGDDDIDLFLFDSNGDIVAESTSGGTDELIEIAMPEDDTYKLIVHGWSVPNAPLAYSVSFWSIPLTPGGGSLSVDSAPESAVFGTAGTVEISWLGLTSGEKYLGAVSHSDAHGILGFTAVEVTG